MIKIIYMELFLHAMNFLFRDICVMLYVSFNILSLRKKDLSAQTVWSIKYFFILK